VALLFLLDSHFPGDDIPDSPNGLTHIPFHDEVKCHLRNLAPLGAQEKLAYMAVRVRAKITERTARINKIFKKVACKVYIAMGYPLPPFLRSPYILDVYQRALQNYLPQPYPGSAIYIKSEKRSSDHRLNWTSLIAAGLEVHEVLGDHMDVVKEPYANVWAKKLRIWLDTAQENRDRPVSKDNSALYQPLKRNNHHQK
jgi:thioesterase domain-containing protein